MVFRPASQGRHQEPQFDSVSVEEVIATNKETDVTYYLERLEFGESIVIIKRLKKEVVRRTITVEEIRLFRARMAMRCALCKIFQVPPERPSEIQTLFCVCGGNTQVFLNHSPSPRISLWWLTR